MKENLRILILRSNGVDPDPRVEKEARALSAIGQIHILARDRVGTSQQKEDLGYAKIERIRLKGGESGLWLIFSLIYWWIYLFFTLLFRRYDIIHACDFDTYLPAIFASKICRKKIVYDIFDFYADTFSFAPRAMKTISWIDRKIMVWADIVILPDEARQKQIAPAKPRELIFVYNTPEIDPSPLEEVRKKTKDNYFFYTGMLSEERMIKETVLLFTNHPEWELRLGGWGPLEEFIKKEAEKSKNISFSGRVPYQEVLEGTLKTKICLAFYDPRVANNRYASPNKLFEAMAYGKPIITNKGTTMAQLVEREKIGFTINYEDAADLEKNINTLLDNKKLYQEMSEHTQRLYVEKYNWQQSAKTLLKAYSKLVG